MIKSIKNVYIAASTNTDIPNYYARWLVSRLHAGFVDQVAYSNPELILRASLDVVDVKGFIFYSKNYGPFLQQRPPLSGRPLVLFFTLGDSYVFHANLPALEKLFDQVRCIIDLYGRGSLVWKLPPLMFDASGQLIYLENIPRVASFMASVGVTRCMLELFSPGFHPTEIMDRLRRWGVHDISTDEGIAWHLSIEKLSRDLEGRYGIEVIGQDYWLFSDLQISDIEDRIGVFDIGRMGMPCPTKCLYCDTNFTCNYDNDGLRRTSIVMAQDGYSRGLESYFGRLGLDVCSSHPEEPRIVSPYAIELRQRVDISSAELQSGGESAMSSDRAVSLVVNLIGDPDKHERAYCSHRVARAGRAQAPQILCVKEKAND